jgi:hypothetical protein
MFGSLGYAAITSELGGLPPAELIPFDAETPPDKAQVTRAPGQANIDPDQFSLFQLLG